jgi:RNA polymerase sigma factor (sigma-70 family)
VELQEIVERIREGETAEFGRLVAGYRDMAFGYALTLLDQEQMAEDVVQEALLIAYTHLDRLRQPQAFGAWLRGIVRHQCSRARRGDVPTVSWEQLDEPGSDGASPADATLDAFVREQVRNAVGELPPAQREVVQLHYETGLSQGEIATRLSLTVPTINMRLHAARMRLRRRLQPMTDIIASDTVNSGRVQEAQGPIVTVQFAPKAMPPLFSQLTSDSKDSLCVIQHLSAGRVRAVSTRPTAIWTPGQEIIDTGQLFTQPLDQTTVQRVVDELGENSKSKIQNPKSTEFSPPVLLPSGIKTIEVFAPLTQGGSTGVFTEWGLGVLVLLPELLRHLDREENRQKLFVFIPPMRDAQHWQEVTAEITVGNRNIEIITLPVADPISLEFTEGIRNLDTILVLSRRLAEQAIWPCLDPLSCRSDHLDSLMPEMATVAAKVRMLLTQYYTLQFSLDGAGRRMLSQQEQLLVQRARKALRFLSQPFFVAEPYTGRPGVFVTAEEALRGFADILSGHYDTLSKDQLYMIGAAPAP